VLIDVDIKIKREFGLPIGRVVKCPKKYNTVYYLDAHGFLRTKKTSNQQTLEYLTYDLNSKSHYYEADEQNYV
jgi:hypothetical protein